MDWVSFQSNRTEVRPVLPHPISPPRLVPPPPPSPVPSSGGLDGGISPSILLIIVILAVVFFVSGLLHLLVRYVLRPNRRDPEDPHNDVTALQGQLQQLFHLHDAGVDQSFIDALPVFPYKAIIGLKDPFDCAVCLCEFEADDKLRLLPRCSHAFHLECIDTWLLSHSTCPLCRSSLLLDFPAAHGCSPLVLVLESGGESSREIVADREPTFSAQLAPHVEDDLRPPRDNAPQKTGETAVKEVEATASEAPELPARVVPVKLGKFRNVDAGAGAGGEESSSSGNGNLDERRCFSMGSFEYVMDESSLLQVAIRQPARKPSTKKPGHRPAMSECGCNSRREGFKVIGPSRGTSELRGETGSYSARISANSQQRDSFSISKIWLWSGKEKSARDDGPTRVLSFRLPLQLAGAGTAEGTKPKYGSSRRTTASELDVASSWDKSGSEVSWDMEAGSCNDSVVSRGEETRSFARTTLLWIVGGRHPKVVNHA